MELGRTSREDAVSLLSRLVAIDSVNPSLIPGAAGEADIARFVASWLQKAGLEATLVEIAPGRPNVIARLPGKGGGRSLILNAHMDTVGVAGMENPFDPRVEGDRLFGRGAQDMKGGLAAIMLACRSLARSDGASGDIWLTAVMDEEYASLGTQAVVESFTADGAIITEPTDLQICVAHKGFAWATIETVGTAAHGSRPELGIDAIAHMGRVLGEIESLQQELSGSAPHPLLGHGSIHASLIDGGQELSSYPASCRLQIERRTIPGETPETVIEEIRSRLARLSAADDRFSAAAELHFWRDPFEVPHQEFVVRSLQQCATDVLGSPPAVVGDAPWMDAALLSAVGIPTVIFGPGGAGEHAAVEYASISEVGLCADILARTAVVFCAGSHDRETR